MAADKKKECRLASAACLLTHRLIFSGVEPRPLFEAVGKSPSDYKAKCREVARELVPQLKDSATFEPVGKLFEEKKLIDPIEAEVRNNDYVLTLWGLKFIVPKKEAIEQFKLGWEQAESSAEWPQLNFKNPCDVFAAAAAFIVFPWKTKLQEEKGKARGNRIAAFVKWLKGGSQELETLGRPNTREDVKVRKALTALNRLKDPASVQQIVDAAVTRIDQLTDAAKEVRRRKRRDREGSGGRPKKTAKPSEYFNWSDEFSDDPHNGDDNEDSPEEKTSERGSDDEEEAEEKKLKPAVKPKLKQKFDSSSEDETKEKKLQASRKPKRLIPNFSDTEVNVAVERIENEIVCCSGHCSEPLC